MEKVGESNRQDQGKTNKVIDIKSEQTTVPDLAACREMQDFVAALNSSVRHGVLVQAKTQAREITGQKGKNNTGRIGK